VIAVVSIVGLPACRDSPSEPIPVASVPEKSPPADAATTVALDAAHEPRIEDLVDGVTADRPTKAEATPQPKQGRLGLKAKRAFDETTLTVDGALQPIMERYMAGIKRCYGDVLGKQPDVRGDVVLSFTVRVDGTCEPANVVGFLPQLDACISRAMSAWRFPVPKTSGGSATSARFELKLLFTPD
jgi:outer membrane biosynthesis protein TonB